MFMMAYCCFIFHSFCSFFWRSWNMLLQSKRATYKRWRSKYSFSEVKSHLLSFVPATTKIKIGFLNFLHDFSSYKKRLYKKRLVDLLGCKKWRLVNILTAKKRVSQFFHLSWPIFVIFSKILSVFSKIALFSLKLTLF